VAKHPPVRQRPTAALGGHQARKRFGQNFLSDRAIIEALVAAIAPQPGQAMVEIGPGLGALTQPLVERLAACRAWVVASENRPQREQFAPDSPPHSPAMGPEDGAKWAAAVDLQPTTPKSDRLPSALTVIELDRDLAQRLRAQPQLRVIEADVLRVDFAALAADWPTGAGLAALGPAPTEAAPQRLRIVGNLPYNISSPILFHLLPCAAVVQDQHFMLQQEVVARMVAAPCSADYGRLSVMLQWRYAMEQVLRVPPQSFTPAPRVDSAVVRMVPLAQPAALHLPTLENLVRAAFSQRRKLLRHSLGRWLDEQGYSGHFDVQRRAEEVPVPQYLELAQALGARDGARASST